LYFQGFQQIYGDKLKSQAILKNNFSTKNFSGSEYFIAHSDL
jgi:hypothetical protein